MLTAFATVLVGIGLFFYGMRLVGDELKHLAGRRVRSLFSKLTKNRFISILAGFISGAITQSTSNASLIITNLVVSRLLDVKNAIPVIAASNIGTVLLVFLVVVNIKLAVLYLLGITAILYSLNKNMREKPIVGVILGIGIILFGFNTFVSEAKMLFNTPEIKNSLLFLKEEYFYFTLPFILGLVLRFFTQSTSTVSIIAISLCQTGVIDVNQTLLIVFGAPIGSVVTLIIVSMAFKGAAKQIAFFQIIFETTGSVILTLILSIELVFKIPLLNAFLGYLSNNMAGQIAFALLLMRVIPFVLSILLNNHIVKFLENVCPPSLEEKLLKPVYIYDGAIEDPETAMDLLEREQLRLLERFPMAVENIRIEHDVLEIIGYEILHNSNQKLQCEIDDFTTEMFKNNLGRDVSERLIKLQNMQNYITLIEDNLYHFVKDIAEARLQGGVNDFVGKIVESLHVVLIINLEMSQPDSKELIKQVIKMTSDKEKLMEIMRKPFLSDNNGFTNNDQTMILNITNLYQRIIWLINREAILYAEISLAS